MVGLRDPDRMRILIATPLCELLEEREPRLEVVRDQSLLPPMRWSGDYEGALTFARTAEEQARFDELVDSADAFYGIPDPDLSPHRGSGRRRGPAVRRKCLCAAGRPATEECGGYR